MHKQKTAPVLLLLFVCCFLTSFSQISISNNTGCMPNGVLNAILSYGGTGAITNVNWNFGDNTPSSSLNPTQHSFSSAGSFTVTLTGTVGGSQVTYTTLVTVHNPPSGAISGISIPSSHCLPMQVAFNGTGTGSNLSYAWDFGNGIVGNGNPATHVYQTSGTYTPILTITNSLTGCYFNVTGAPVFVSALPTIPVSTSNGLSSCSSPFSTAFSASNAVSGSPIAGGTLSFNWNMGAFGVASGPTTGPISFSPQGLYPVVVTVTDNNNCSNSATVTVSLITPSVIAVVPPTVCVNSQLPGFPPTPITLPNVSYPNFTIAVQSSQQSVNVQLGDGNSTPFPVPVPPPLQTPVLSSVALSAYTIHSYFTPGIKILTITATAGQCSDVFTTSIMVESITPQFVAPPPIHSCSSPFNLSFVNQTTVNTSNTLNYSWQVNHWDNIPAHVYASSATNPTFNITQGSLNQYTYFNSYPATTTLIVVSQPNACTAQTIQTLDTLQRPTAIFETDKSEGCSPLTVSFTDMSITNFSVYPISSYTWNFGASPSSTVAANSATVLDQVFTYTAPGVYYATLSINTASGCVHTSYVHTITVAAPPAFTYAMPASPLCWDTPVQFTLTPIAPHTVQHWHVEGDRGYFSDCITNNTPAWNFNHTGIHNFTITAYQHGCKTTSVIPTSLAVKGPIGKARFETNCTGNKKAVKFYYNLDDVDNAVLDFGDNSSVNITGMDNGIVTGNVTHTFATSGEYTVTMTSTNNNGCAAYTFTMLVTVRDLQANFTVLNPVICADGYLYLDASSSVDVFTTTSTGYTWFTDNLPPLQRGIDTYTATENSGTVGMHNITLVVKDVNGCKDQMTKQFRVSAPAPAFSFNSNPICLSNMPLQLNNTTPQSPDPIINYHWTMGDSNYVFSQQHSTFNGTLNPSPSFDYAIAMLFGNPQVRTFSVVLTATNSIGCKSSVRHDITVSNPVLSVIPPFKQCIPETNSLSITAAPTHTAYQVKFGDGNVFNTTSYNTANTYYLGHTYMTPGIYTPTVTVTDNAGCSKTGVFGPIVVHNYPVPTFTFANTAPAVDIPGTNGKVFCGDLTLSVTPTALDPNISHTFMWEFGNAPMTLLSEAPAAIVTQFGQFTITLQVATNMGCASYSSQVYMHFDPKIEFEFMPDPDKTTYCLGTPISMSVTTMENGCDRFKWDFGDGVIRPITQAPPNIPFLRQATYTNTFFPVLSEGALLMQVTGYYGQDSLCPQAFRKEVKIIRVLPEFDRNKEAAPIDYVHCLGSPDLFKNNSSTNSPSSLTYTWNFGDGTPPSYVTDISHVYTQPGYYTVSLAALETAYNCTASASKQMTIWPSPTATLVVPPNSCPSVPYTVSGSGTPGTTGQLTGTLSPLDGAAPLDFSATNSFSSSTSATVSTNYTLRVTDQNGCMSAPVTSSIFIQQPTPVVNWDTTIVIGQTVALNAYVGPNFTYTWTPLTDYLDCDTCLTYNPVSSTTMNITYSVMVEDGFQCSVVKNTYRITIEPKVSVDIPTAFTPNGDGINDMIFPGGWGIRKLNYFKIFNRWGHLVFESNDLSVGWDGVLNGVPQNMETYVYQVSVETYLEKEPTLTKTGTFKLIR